MPSGIFSVLLFLRCHPETSILEGISLAWMKKTSI